MAEVEIRDSPTKLRIEGYFYDDLEKGYLASHVWASATSGCKLGKLKEVLVVAGESYIGNGAYAIALDPPYFPDEHKLRYCRTAAYLEQRTEEEIRQFIGVFALPYNYSLPVEILRTIPSAFSIKTHIENGEILKIINSDDSMDLLDDLHAGCIPASEPLIDQLRDDKDRKKRMLEELAKASEHIKVLPPAPKDF